MKSDSEIWNERIEKMGVQAINKIVSLLPDMVCRYNAEGVIIEAFLGESSEMPPVPSERIGKDIATFMDRENSDLIKSCIKEALQDGKVKSYKTVQMVNGISKQFESRMMRYNDHEVVALVRDGTVKQAAIDLSDYLMNRDYVTKVYNGQYFEKKYGHNVAEWSTCLIMLDIDGLKVFNEGFGYLFGNEILKNVVEVLQTVCPPTSELFRVGGDEFAIVIPEFDEEKTTKLVNTIYQEIYNQSVHNAKYTVTLGWEVIFPADKIFADVLKTVEKSLAKKKLLKIQSQRYEIVRVMMKLLNQRNERERLHSERVSQISRKIGEAMALDIMKLHELELAGLVHDVGKIVVENTILNKASALSSEEYDIIKRHPTDGANILRTIDEQLEVADIILHHHERYDGMGYPQGISGEKIPLLSRIICIADAYEAMTANRAYRAARSHEEAMEELVINAGTQFDPEIVRIFCNSGMDLSV